MFYYIKNNIPNILNETNFNEIGGKAVGIEILRLIVFKIDIFKMPFTFILKKNIDFESIKSELEENKKRYSYKFSTCTDDFSNKSIRGKNSSNSKSIELSSNDISDLYQIKNNTINYKSIIIQEYIKNKKYFFLLHKKKEHLIIELLVDDISYLYICSNDKIISYESSSIDTYETGKQYFNKINKLIHSTQEIYNIVGFEFNVEGFFIFDFFYLIQFRSIPKDFLTNVKNKYLIKYKKYSYSTNFVFNDFFINLKKYPLVVIRESYIQRINIQNNMELIICLNYSKKLPLEINFIKKTIYNKIYCLVINLNTGFFLSHSPKHIPSNIKYRKYLYCFSFKYQKNMNSIINNCLALSDGEKLILIKKEGNGKNLSIWEKQRISIKR